MFYILIHAYSLTFENLLYVKSCDKHLTYNSTFTEII